MEEKNHLEVKVFWLIAAAMFVVFAYIWAITFIPLPKENLRFADTAQGFFLGTILAGCIGYYTGGNPANKKTTTTTATDITVTETK